MGIMYCVLYGYCVLCIVYCMGIMYCVLCIVYCWTLDKPMASLSTCHLGLWLGWQILLNLVKYYMGIMYCMGIMYMYCVLYGYYVLCIIWVLCIVHYSRASL